MRNKGNRGITLIALVITIIVLLILAGVAINTLTGENGILNQATTAKETNKKAEAEEAVDLILNEWQIRKRNEGISLQDFLNEKQAKAEINNLKPNGDGTYSLEKDGYTMNITADGKRKKDGEKAVVEPVSLEDWEYDEETGTIYFKEGTTYVSGNNYDTFVIPNSYNGKAVKRIAGKAYNYYIGSNSNVKAKKIIVSEGIEEIGNRILGEIGAEEIILPSTLTTIEEHAFGYNNITEIFIPKSVRSIGYGIFNGCSKLQAINCETELSEGKTVPDGWNSSWYSGYDTSLLDKIHWGVDISK